MNPNNVSPDDGSAVRRQSAGSSTLGRWVIGGFVAFLVICLGIGIWRAMSDRPVVIIADPTGRSEQTLEARNAELQQENEAPKAKPPVCEVLAKKMIAEAEAPVARTPAPRKKTSSGAPVSSVELRIGLSKELALNKNDGFTTYVKIPQGTHLSWVTIPVEAPAPVEDFYIFPDGTKIGPEGEILVRYGCGSMSEYDVDLTGMKVTLLRL